MYSYVSQGIKNGTAVCMYGCLMHTHCTLATVYIKKMRFVSLGLVFFFSFFSCLRDGNPLVYGGAISRVEGDPVAGDVVDVIDSSGKFIAWGKYFAASRLGRLI